MRYFIDTEFNGYGGALISLAMVREDGKALYGVLKLTEPVVDWVSANVLPILMDVPKDQTVQLWRDKSFIARDIAEFLLGDTSPLIISDWPDDIRHFCDVLITGPGQMHKHSGQFFSMEIVRTDSWPNAIPGAIQHNAYWDAMALKEKLGC